jgi:hypothetical protein
MYTLSRKKNKEARMMKPSIATSSFTGYIQNAMYIDLVMRVGNKREK